MLSWLDIQPEFWILFFFFLPGHSGNNKITTWHWQISWGERKTKDSI